ncbi:hypothetical protein [Kitasatospora sp. KL5]|uniref:hypothetical protein n=1 Tax=Kitasatospora sp. KL5 TaxID=3425125 RepID=UPI003D6EBAF9
MLGNTGYRWAADALALEFAGGGLVARGHRFDSTNIDPCIVEAGIHAVTMVSRTNGAWGADGADMLTGQPPVTWATDPGPDLEPQQLCVEITPAVQAAVRSHELEHVQDFVLAWALTVGLFVDTLPTGGYASAENALADRLVRTGLQHLVPPASRTRPEAWVQHLKTRATQLADQSKLRDTNGSHTPVGYTARLDHGNGQRRIVLTPEFRPAGPPTAVLDIRLLPS